MPPTESPTSGPTSSDPSWRQHPDFLYLGEGNCYYGNYRHASGGSWSRSTEPYGHTECGQKCLSVPGADQHVKGMQRRDAADGSVYKCICLFDDSANIDASQFDDTYQGSPEPMGAGDIILVNESDMLPNWDTDSCYRKV